MSNNVENVIPCTTVVGELQSDATVKFTLNYEKYFYIRDSLERAYHRRDYIRKYQRELHNSKQREYPVTPALLLYMHDSELLEPSIYYKQVRAYLVDESIIFQIPLDQAHIIQDVLYRRYNRDKATKGYRYAKRPDAPRRNMKRCAPVLIAIPGQN